MLPNLARARQHFTEIGQPPGKFGPAGPNVDGFLAQVGRSRQGKPTSAEFLQTARVEIAALAAARRSADRRDGQKTARVALCAAEACFLPAGHEPQRRPGGWPRRRCGRRLAPCRGGALRCTVPQVWDGDQRRGADEATVRAALARVAGVWKWAGRPRKAAPQAFGNWSSRVWRTLRLDGRGRALFIR